MSKKLSIEDFQEMGTDDLRDYWIALCVQYQDMIAEAKKKNKELKAAVREAHLLINELKEGM